MLSSILLYLNVTAQSGDATDEPTYTGTYVADRVSEQIPHVYYGVDFVRDIEGYLIADEPVPEDIGISGVYTLTHPDPEHHPDLFLMEDPENDLSGLLIVSGTRQPAVTPSTTTEAPEVTSTPHPAGQGLPVGHMSSLPPSYMFQRMVPYPYGPLYPNPVDNYLHHPMYSSPNPPTYSQTRGRPLVPGPMSAIAYHPVHHPYMSPQFFQSSTMYMPHAFMSPVPPAGPPPAPPVQSTPVPRPPQALKLVDPASREVVELSGQAAPASHPSPPETPLIRGQSHSYSYSSTTRAQMDPISGVMVHEPPVVSSGGHMTVMDSNGNVTVTELL